MDSPSLCLLSRVIDIISMAGPTYTFLYLLLPSTYFLCRWVVGHVIVWMWNVPQVSCVKGIVFNAALFRGSAVGSD
jgi:hypothetical protein